MMTKTRKLGKQKILILLASFFFLCVFFCGITFSVYHLITSKTKSTSQDIFGEYRILEVDSSGEKISRGIVSLPDNIFFENSEYVKYTTFNENHVLISKFGTEEFVCSGFCFCSEERRIVGSSNIVRKGVTTLIAALSSILAYEKAKEYFSEECETKLSQTCSSSSIESEIDSCESIIPLSESEEENILYPNPLEAETFTETNEEESTQTMDTSVQDQSSRSRVYECEGECIPRKDVEEWTNGDQAKEKLEEMNYCRNFNLKTEITLDKSEMTVGEPQRTFGKTMRAFCIEQSEVALVRPRYTKTYQTYLCRAGKSGCKMKREKTKIRKYWCKGSCLNRKTTTDPARRLSEGVDCGALVAEGEVTFSTEDITKRSYLRNYHISRHLSTHAKILFGKETLVNFCKANSIQTYNAARTEGRMDWRGVKICSIDRKSVSCFQTYPVNVKSTRNWKNQNIE